MDSSDVYIAEFSKLYCFLGLFFLSVYESCTSLVKFILSTLFFFKKNYFFFYFWLHWVFRCCARAFSSCREQGLVPSCGAWVSIAVVLLLWSTGSRDAGLSSCSSQALECRLSSCGAWA